MSLKRTFLAGLMALCLGVSSLAAADGIYVKRDSMGRILLEQIGPELTLFDLNKKGVLCNYSGKLASPNRVYTQVPLQKTCHKYEVFNKKSKIVMTYLVAKDLSEAYRVKPNGEALQIYARGGLG